VKITDVEIRTCGVTELSSAERGKLRGHHTPDVVVITLTTDEGLSGTAFGFGGLDAKICAPSFEAVKPFMIGRDPMAREKNFQDFQFFDRRWNVLPIWVWGPFDVACWDIAGQAAGLPIYQLLGAARERVPVYASSMFLETDQDYLDEALEVQRRGYRGYKLHPPGPADRDMALYTAVRELVGPDYALMTDPVATHSYAEAVRVGRHLESLGYLWFEEPICDHDMYTLQKLTATLDIPIAATEAIAGLHTSTASYIANRACDIVRADVSWRGGITGVMKIATLAEAFGMKCEIHTSIYEALEFGNLHCALAVSNSDFLELLYPVEDYSFGIRHGLPISDGYASAPELPGLGVEYDWDWIDDATIAKS